MKQTKLKKYTFDEIKDRHIGKRGTPQREAYENELKLELIGEMIKKARKERNLTQAQLGKLVGVQKAQISKLENNARNVTIDTVLKVFHALKAQVSFKVSLANEKLTLT
jgi:DNA-binding XRE family transcriptional regulator